MKKLTAMLMVMAALFALLAGCEVNIENTDPTEATMPDLLDPNAVKSAADELGVDLDNLDDQALKELQEKLTRPDLTLGENNNLEVALPEGVTKPAETTTKAPPTTMPKGAAAQSSEVYPLVKAVLETMNSGKFYLKGYSTSAAPGIDVAFGDLAGNYSLLIIAVDGNQMALENEVDWVAMLKASSEGNDFGSATALGLTMQTAYGKRLRMLFNNDGMYIVFPEKKKYTSFSDMLGEEASGEFADAGDLVGSMFGEVNTAALDNLESSRVTSGGKEYLCATLPSSDSSAMKLYFLGGELKRIETITSSDSGDVSTIIDVEEFNGSPDPSLFSTKGMSTVKLAELTNLFSKLG